ncbi:MAG: methyltransferase domain-containing protein [Flavobacteriales bacterium]|nr:methyltransferase domain-containing protein [Flavobacteriales bacterium]
MDPFTEPRLTRDTQDIYPVRRNILETVTKALPALHGTFLDIGCGDMPYRALILSGGKVTTYLGMDLHSATAKRAVKPDLEWDGRTMPLADASVDSAMATEVLEHCAEPLVLLREAHRVLRPGGTLLLTMPFLWPLHEVPYDEHRYTPWAVERLLKEAGFASARVKALGGWDASLGQMIGLWAMRRPMQEWKRAWLKRITLPLVRALVRRENVGNLMHGPMITAVTAIATK